MDEEQIKTALVRWLDMCMSGHGWDAAKLARTSGLSPVSIQCYLDGSRLPSLPAFIALTKALRYDTSSFFDAVEFKRDELTGRELVLLAAVEALPRPVTFADLAKALDISQDSVSRIAFGLESDKWLVIKKPLWGGYAVSLGPAWEAGTYK